MSGRQGIGWFELLDRPTKQLYRPFVPLSIFFALTSPPHSSPLSHKLLLCKQMSESDVTCPDHTQAQSAAWYTMRPRTIVSMFAAAGARIASYGKAHGSGIATTVMSAS